jgi:SAM-dependent methyltransferase
MHDAFELACPVDKTPLRRAGEAYLCDACDGRFPVERGVVRFLPGADEFYEGRYLYTIRFVPRRESPLWAWPLWLINSGYCWTVRSWVPAGATVIEMGCGGGVAYFAHRYRMIGLDLSGQSLAGIANLYAACLQADAARGIPLPDSSVDAVVSSYAWEHVPPDQKPRVLAECARVLRPGGRLVFLYDLDSQSPLYECLKRRDGQLFREVLIDREGHRGWQTLQENRAIFEANGFCVREDRGKEKLFIAPAMFDKIQHWGGGLRRLASLGLRFRSGPAYHVYSAGIRLFDATVGRLLPESWARVAVTVCEKRASREWLDSGARCGGQPVHPTSFGREPGVEET